MCLHMYGTLCHVNGGQGYVGRGKAQLRGRGDSRVRGRVNGEDTRKGGRWGLLHCLQFNDITCLHNNHLSSCVQCIGLDSQSPRERKCEYNYCGHYSIK